MTSKETLQFIESVTKSSDFTDDEIGEIRGIGNSLAKNQTYADDEIEDLDLDGLRTLIKCEKSGVPLSWKLRVLDSVGVIGTNRVDIFIEPKIPLKHFVHIVRHAFGVPRIHKNLIQTEMGETFWEVLAHWFIGSVEQQLQFGLARGYREASMDLGTVRGRVDGLKSVRNWMSGRPLIHCAFDEFDTDVHVNRVLLAAIRRVAAVTMSQDLRRRSVRLQRDFFGVGSLRSGDLNQELERAEGGWRPAWIIGKRLLAAQGNVLNEGSLRGQSFLFRTPPLIEEGIREILAEELRGFALVGKGRKLLAPTKLSANPDLTFQSDSPTFVIDQGDFVGDVKYQLSDGTWDRKHLEQIVFFNAVFEGNGGVVINFQTHETSNPGRPIVRGVEYCVITWDARPEVNPQEAQEKFVSQVREWLMVLRSRQAV